MISTRSGTSRAVHFEFGSVEFLIVNDPFGKKRSSNMNGLCVCSILFNEFLFVASND